MGQWASMSWSQSWCTRATVPVMATMVRSSLHHFPCCDCLLMGSRLSVASRLPVPSTLHVRSHWLCQLAAQLACVVSGCLPIPRVTGLAADSTILITHTLPVLVGAVAHIRDNGGTWWRYDDEKVTKMGPAPTGSADHGAATTSTPGASGGYADRFAHTHQQPQPPLTRIHHLQ
jgi:hypothetical protein